ncbi:amidase [Atractiella rhizophila]|nr:amidase [Atractiella rhizophila]
MRSLIEAVEEKRFIRKSKLPSKHLLPDDLLLQLPQSDSLIDLIGPHLDQKQRDIVSSKPSVLLESLRTGRITSLEVVEAFIASSSIAQQTVNCLTEILFDEARQRAKELDDLLRTTGKPVGSLHGLPVSVKETCNIKGVETTLGYVGWIGNAAKFNSLLVDILLEQGAVIYCKTNVPQTMMTGESHNNVFGPVLNPHNRTLTPGGSSGGEAALLTMKGSLMGLGTDIAGSVRMPAACTGIYALKPSTQRLFSTWGSGTTVPGQESIAPCYGPMSSSVEGIEILCQAISDGQPWLVDSKIIPLPWNAELVHETSIRSKLTFAVMRDDGIVIPHPPVIDAIHQTVVKLRAAGHEVIEWPKFDYEPVQAVAAKAFVADGCVKYRAALEQGQEKPLGPILLGHGAILGDIHTELSVSELWDLHAERNKLTNMHLAHWQATKRLTSDGRPIDALITPAAAHTAPPHNNFTYLGYTSVFNVFDWPSAVLPTPGLVDQTYSKGWNRAEFLASRNPLNELDKKNLELYDPKKFAGGPFTVQIICPRLQEEKLIGIMKAIDGVLNQ